MPAPSKAFSAPTNGQVDADSPGDTTLLTQIRDSLVHLEEWLGLDYTAAQNHDHDGANSKAVFGAAAASIAQSMLKTTTGAVSHASNAAANYTLPGGTYGFYPQIKHSSGSGSLSAAAILFNNSGDTLVATANIGTSYVTNITLRTQTGTTLYAQQCYIQASPPYKIGDKLWGHFLFLLRDIATGTVRAAYEAEDPPWAYNGAVYLPKDDPGRLAEVPHPFADYWLKDPAIDGLEIVLVDLTMRDVKKAKQDNAKLGRGLLEDIPLLIAGKGTAKAQSDYLLPNIPRFSEQVKIYEP